MDKVAKVVIADVSCIATEIVGVDTPHGSYLYLVLNKSKVDGTYYHLLGSLAELGLVIAPMGSDPVPAHAARTAIDILMGEFFDG